MQSQHEACAKQQKERTNLIFRKLEEMGHTVDGKVAGLNDKMDAGFAALTKTLNVNMTELNKDIKDILKNTK